MIGRAIRTIPWRVIIPGTIGSIIYLGWLEIVFAMIKVIVERNELHLLAHIRPREIIVDSVLAGKFVGASFIFAAFLAPFLAGMLCAVAFTRNLKINKNTFTTPLYIGIVLGFLFSVRFTKRKSVGLP